MQCYDDGDGDRLITGKIIGDSGKHGAAGGVGNDAGHGPWSRYGGGHFAVFMCGPIRGLFC